MDPLTQGLLGSTAAQNTSKKQHIVIASILGFLAGMAPDLDVLINSETDPLLFLEYHRQFTHSLIFIPVGGLICGILLHFIFAKRRGLELKQSILFCTAGYATHALLDSCTSYGTLLLWPFSDIRIAWNNISIIDPLYTLPILVLLLSTAFSKNKLYAKIALAWVLLYPLIGVVQRERAKEMGWELASERGHQPIQLHAKPSFANLLVWKIIYETDNRYYIDAVRAGLQKNIYPGDSIKKLDVETDFPWLDPESQQARDIERFRWFSNGFVAVDPHNPNRVIDVRYSLIPNKLEALWGIELSKNADNNSHVRYTHTTQSRQNASKILMDMILNKQI